MTPPNPTPDLFDAPTAHQQFALARQAARQFIVEVEAEQQLDWARSFCTVMQQRYWRQRARAARCDWEPPTSTISAKLPAEQHRIATHLGVLAAAFDDIEAGFRLGSVYTALLPAVLRSRWGAYYTPSAYVQLLLGRIEQAGFDWRRGSAVDPACGGGAFLTPVALRMQAALAPAEPGSVLDHIASHLSGFEIDPFAAWTSQLCVEAALLPLCQQAGRRLPALVSVGDSLAADTGRRFDLVVGNPPYGKVTLEPALRQRYARSLYGHANLYGLFADLSLRWALPDGVIALVTPTSFLGGQYFKALRALLADTAPLRSIDFVDERSGVFEDVLQETSLAVFVKGAPRTAATVHAAQREGDLAVRTEPLGEHRIGPGDGPWLLPRLGTQRRLIARAGRMPTRLADYGMSVSTGPLVWNRHKTQLRAQRSVADHPLIWAECVSAEGFRFDPQRKHHAPFIEVEDGQGHLLIACACLLVQRTTAKEQRRRLIGAVMPGEFVTRYRGVVVENHLNVITPVTSTAVGLDALCALLNSEAVDQAFRCISGSVAVSAYELNDLPLPDPATLARLSGANPGAFESALSRLYGLS